MSPLISIQHAFSEAKQHLRRHPGNYLSTRLCLVSDRLLSGIHLRDPELVLRTPQDYGFYGSRTSGSHSRLRLGSPSFRDDDGGRLQEFVEY